MEWINDLMAWFFDGIGTLLVGLLIGGGAGTAITWKVMSRRTKMTQRAGDHASQVMVGRNYNKGTK